MEIDEQLEEQPFTPINTIAPQLPETKRTSMRRTAEQLRNLRVRSESPVGDRSKSFYEMRDQAVQRQIQKAPSSIDLRTIEQMAAGSSNYLANTPGTSSINTGINGKEVN